MLQFGFRINKSFIENNGHPVTIPRSQVRYRDLELFLGSARDGSMRFPDGSVVPVFVYSNTAGYGPYYQLRARHRSSWALTRAQAGQLIELSIGLQDGGVVVDVRAR